MQTHIDNKNPTTTTFTKIKNKTNKKHTLALKKNTRDDLLNNINNILLGYSIQKLQQQQNIILKLKCENRFIYYIHT